MEPRGTPPVTEAGDEWDSTEKLLAVKQDSNHSKAESQIPTSVFNLFKRMPWSTVSNAALKSNSTKTAQFLESTNNNKSFTTLNKADSVLCLDLKPDWKGSNILFSIK